MALRTSQKINKLLGPWSHYDDKLTTNKANELNPCHQLETIILRPQRHVEQEPAVHRRRAV